MFQNAPFSARKLCIAVLCLTSLASFAQKPAKPAANAASTGCLITELKAIGLSTHNIQQRMQRTKDWLVNNGGKCTEIQVRMINSNRGNWLGTADDAEVSAMLDALMEAKIAHNPELMSQAFDSKGKEGTASVEETKPPPRPAPVVPPPAPVILPPGMPVQSMPPNSPPPPGSRR